MKHIRPFIPAWIDELKLTPTQFRIYVHLWRRANRHNVCWPSVRSIADACGVNRDTVWPALKVFEAGGLILRGKKHRNSNSYSMLFPAGDGGTVPPTETPESAESFRHDPAEPVRQELAESTGQQLAEPFRHQGNSGKVPQRSVPIYQAKHGFIPLGIWEGCTAELEAEYAGIDARHDHHTLEIWLRDFNADWKLWYKVRGNPTKDDFKAYVGKQLKDRSAIRRKNGRTFDDADSNSLRNFRDTVSGGQSFITGIKDIKPAAPLLEPDGWREALVDDDAIDSFYFKAKWDDGQFREPVKRYIVEAMTGRRVA